MALITEITEKHPDRVGIHGGADATFHVFEKDGEMYLQIDSYGSENRKDAAKVSQSMQFGSQGLIELRRLLGMLP